MEVPANLQDSSKRQDQALWTASITVKQAVFEPRHWIDLMTRYSLPRRYEKGVSVTAAVA